MQELEKDEEERVVQEKIKKQNILLRNKIFLVQWTWNHSILRKQSEFFFIGSEKSML